MKSGNYRSRFAPTVACILSVVGSAASAQWYSVDANPTSIGTVSVRLADDIADACWTNLSEVREYAEEKLRQERYQVVPEAGDYTFRVAVWGFRDNQGWCIYNITVSVDSGTFKDGVLGFHTIGEHSSIGTRENNANTSVISVVQRMINAM